MVAKVFFLKIKIVYKGHNFHFRIFAFKSFVSFYPFDISFSYSNSRCQPKRKLKNTTYPQKCNLIHEVEKGTSNEEASWHSFNNEMCLSASLCSSWSETEDALGHKQRLPFAVPYGKICFSWLLNSKGFEWKKN